MKLHCDARGQLWAKDINGNPTRRIPAIGDREAIIKEAMANLLYPSRQRVYVSNTSGHAYSGKGCR